MLQVRLKEKLSGKRFLIVLDDVWNERYADWEILRSPLQSGAPGSKILVTTRSSKVSALMSATDYHIKGLSQDESFSLFKGIVGEEVFSGDPEFEAIARRIIESVNGLPLQVKSIAAVLRSKQTKSEWLSIAKSDLLLRGSTDHLTMAVFLLSYNHLPSLFKRCFAYCSIFPKDYEFMEKEMVLLWTAEGFLSKAADNNINKFELGEACFRELVACSLFQRSTSTTDDSRFVMHHAIHDVARSVAGNICFRMEGDGKMEMPDPEQKQIRHLSYVGASTGEFKNFKASNRLRTFILFDAQYISKDVLHNLLPKLKFLRVLSLREYSMSELPDSIGALRLLRYLDLSRSKIRSLPDVLCALYNLQTLLLRQCRNLEKLPSKIGELINLHHLDISGTALSLRGLPIQIRKLTSLQALPSLNLAFGDGEIIEFDKEGEISAEEKLPNRKGEPSPSGLQDMVANENKVEASDNLDLPRLKLKWSKSFDQMLQPSEMCEKLTIEGYDGTSSPNWVGDPSFSSLKSLELKNCRSMPSLGNLPLLRHLSIKGMYNLASVNAKLFATSSSNVSSSLETLLFEDIPEWEGWNFDEQSVNLFPCLRELSVISCPKLLGRLPGQLPSLEGLVIRRCYQLVVSISSLPLLHQLEIDGCKSLDLKTPVKLSSLREVSLSNISDLTCLTERLILGLRNVESLKIDGFEELTSLRQKKGLLTHMGSLKHLMISNCPKFVPFGAEYDEEDKQQQEISSSINHLNLSWTSCKLPKVSRVFTCLLELQIEKCPKVVSFSEESFPVTLKRFVIRYCENLQYLLDKGKDMNFRDICRLKDLVIERCPSLISLSSSCELPCPKLLEGLKQLHITECGELKSIGNEMPGQLQILKIWRCSKLRALSHNLPESLKRLQIIDCEGLTSIVQTVQDGTALEYIGVIGCKHIQSLPQGLAELRHLREIELVYCPSLKSFPESRLPTALKELKIDECENLQTLPSNFRGLTSLEKLEISNCCFPEEGFPVNLKSLSISQPKTKKKLQEWELHKLTSLELLTIEGGCPDVVSFPPKESEMLLPSSLVQLTIKNFPMLKSLFYKGFERLTSLTYLSIMECPKVVSLPKKDALLKLSLSRLHVDDCPLLKIRCFTGGKECHKIAHIPYVRLDDQMIHKED